MALDEVMTALKLSELAVNTAIDDGKLKVGPCGNITRSSVRTLNASGAEYLQELRA